MFRHPLAREIALILAIKTALLLAAGIFVFGPKQRPAIDARNTQEHLLDAQTHSQNWSLRP